jgi:hypothetical protein
MDDVKEAATEEEAGGAAAASTPAGNGDSSKLGLMEPTSLEKVFERSTPVKKHSPEK